MLQSLNIIRKKIERLLSLSRRKVGLFFSTSCSKYSQESILENSKMAVISGSSSKLVKNC